MPVSILGRENNNCRSVVVPAVRPTSWLSHQPHATAAAAAGYDWHLPAASDYASKACVDPSLLTHARGVMEPSKVGK